MVGLPWMSKQTPGWAPACPIRALADSQAAVAAISSIFLMVSLLCGAAVAA
jgi:hypothetical protein